ncbi:hypothetical protein [Pseudomonas sp. Irchel s3h17]|uniref:hypothetical protein n=1 Tax=Pseudomonas sp. Irchel s3h17 TaxID=2009182 RepID=UPI00117A6E85|nr:hypothetical protein [Pseudomonas sp. Irchel s3h17]
MVHIYTEKAEALMPNSRFVEANIGVFSQAGLMGKAMRNGFLTVVLLTPTLTVKRGFVSVANVRKLPKGLRQKLVVTWGSSTFFFFALIALNMYRRYIE